MSQTTNDTEHRAFTPISVERLAGSRAELKGEISLESIASQRTRAIRRLKQDMVVPGFRKGTVPDRMVIERYGESGIIEEVTRMVLPYAYEHLVAQHGFQVLGKPSVTVAPPTADTPVQFTMTVHVFPEFTLPDYRACAARAVRETDDPLLVQSDEGDVEEEVQRIRDAVLARRTGADQQNPKELTSEELATIGPFTSEAALREAIRTHLNQEKQQAAQEKRRVAIAEELLLKTEVDVPTILIEQEEELLQNDFTQRLARAGISEEVYLEQAKKTKDDLRTEWRAAAEKRSKLEVLFAVIAKKESISPDVERIERDVAHLKEHYRDLDERTIRNNVSHALTREKLFSFLEEEGKKEHPVV